MKVHLTYANVVSTLALVLVISGGTAYASHLVVQGSDVVDHSLTGADVRGREGVAGAPYVNGSLTGWDVADETLRGRDVAANTLSGADVAEATLGRVPAAGKAAVEGYEIVEDISVTDNDSMKTALARCPAGKRVVGGGAFAGPLFINQRDIASSAPDGNNGWYVGIEGPSDQQWYAMAYAICVKATS